MVLFVWLTRKMYSIRICHAVVCDAQPRITIKNVSKGIARPTLKRIFHDYYLTMYREAEQKIVSNKQIGSKLHQVSLAVNYLQLNNRKLICIYGMTTNPP